MTNINKIIETLPMITLGEENTITSVDLVEIINTIRKIESEDNETKYKELKHKDFMKKIRNEVEIMEGLEISQGNISLTSYVDTQGKERPCYLLNRDGMLQMLNSESTLVRVVTIQYINKLEAMVKDLKEDKKQLTEIAMSDEELAIRQYNTKKINYALRNIKGLLEDCDYTNLEQTVDDIINWHTTELKKKDRYEYHRDMSATEYKQMVRAKVLDVLGNLSNNGDSFFHNVSDHIYKRLQSDMMGTSNRSNSHLLGAKDKKIEALRYNVSTLEQNIVKLNNYLDCYVPEQEKFIKLNYRPFSYNKMYEGSDENKVRTKYYDRWIYRFPEVEEVTKEFWEEQGVDFSKRTILHLMFIAPKHCDNDNMIKSIQDQLFVRNFGMDDCDVQIGGAYKIGECDKMREGKIYFYINNELEEEEAM